MAPFDPVGADANASKSWPAAGTTRPVFNAQAADETSVDGLRPVVAPSPAPSASPAASTSSGAPAPAAPERQAPGASGPRHRKTRTTHGNATLRPVNLRQTSADLLRSLRDTGSLKVPGYPKAPAPSPAPELAPRSARPVRAEALTRMEPALKDVPKSIDAPKRVASRPPEPGQVLPVPPSDAEKYSYVRRYNWVLTLCQVLTFPPLLYSQFRMFQTSHWFWLYAPFVVIGLLTFLVSLIADGIGRGFDLAEHRKYVSSWMPLWYPSVDVFLPICGEPIDLLRNTWMNVAALRAAYNGKLTPYVLDDGASPEAKALARELGFAYATRPDRGWYKKSGNLKYGFEISDGEFILLLDADFAPRTDLLDETLPYFDIFPHVGIVQTPQYFHVEDEQTWVERGGGAIQELFYRSIQATRSRKEGAICVGSCAVYRRAALDQNDGMSLSEHSEDLHTGFDLYQLGWRLKYLPIALSTGNCPDNILAFLNQQYRWCSGTFSLLRDQKFWGAPLPPYTRLCYLAGTAGYIYTAIFTFVGPILAISMLIFAPQFLLFKNLIFVAPVLFYAGFIYPMWHRAPYRLESWAVRMLSGWAHIFAIWDMLRGRLRGWQPSGSGAKKQDGRRRLWIGLIGWSFGSAAIWVLLAAWRMMTLDAYNFYLTLALGIFQLTVVGRILIQPKGGATT